MYPESNAAHEASMHPTVPAAEYPDPERLSTQEWPEGILTPTPVDLLRQRAAQRDWRMDVRYSRGRFPHATTGRPGGVRHVIGCRFAHDESMRQAYAVYSRPVSSGAWSWDSRWIHGMDLMPFHLNYVAELELYLQEPLMPPLTLWYSLELVRERAALNMINRAPDQGVSE